MELSSEQRRHAFVGWIRTGWWPAIRTDDGTELKFNPYHDPRNGQFTFAPGGGAGSSSGSAGRVRSHPRRDPDPIDRLAEASRVATRRASNSEAEIALSPAPASFRVGRGSNSRAFEDPMTLEQSFPGLRDAPGGALIAVADNLLDLHGPADAMTAEVLQDQVKQLTSQIKAIDPHWHYDEIGPTDALGHPTYTVQGLNAKVNDLRFQRAAMIARAKGDYEPLKVETVRFVQERTDYAYKQGLASLQNGHLKPRLSNEEALGNFVDRQVRKDLRDRYNEVGINSAGPGPVRVNRRENNSSGGDLTYRRPDARVKDIALDVTLTRKTFKTPQVRGFFNTDFHPKQVIIIRPRQLGGEYTYAIPRSETKP